MNKISQFIKLNKNDILKPIAVLLAICIVIPLALSLTNKLTESRITELEEKNKIDTMKLLIEADSFEEKTLGEDKKTVYYTAVKDEKIVGYIFTTSAKGYGGEVSVMTAVGMDGVIKEVAILDASNETPGLGQNATKESFYSAYSGKTEGVECVKEQPVENSNSIKAITGATITSRAVTNAVNEALDLYKTVTSLSSVYTPESEVQ